MRLLFLVFFIWINPVKTTAQDDRDRIILINESGLIIDTLTNKSLYFIKDDTLTRFLLAKTFSPDNCPSFSIIRGLFKKDDLGYRQLGTRKIIINSKCSSLWNDSVYCIRLEDFKLKKGTSNFKITDSSDKRLKVKIKGDNDFEINLKDRLDKFIDNSECNGVVIE
jgi:hypothetical protein